MRDVQRQKVYRWEDSFVGKRDRSRLTVAQAAAMVPHIWRDMGLEHPPRVEAVAAHATRQQGAANRTSILFRDGAPSFVLLHELAHSMTCDVDGTSERHGPVYVGVYLTLLERYMRIDRTEALASLKAAGIKVDVNARPTILD